jgi:hypothetical protein
MGERVLGQLKAATAGARGNALFRQLHPMYMKVEKTMILQRALILLTLGSVFALPLSANAQETAAQRRHRHAVAAQKASDHQHHTGAKIVVGSAAGGAVVGGLMGGGKGALIGGAVGAGGGALANKAREHHDVKKREARDPR